MTVNSAKHVVDESVNDRLAHKSFLNGLVLIKSFKGTAKENQHSVDSDPVLSLAPAIADEILLSLIEETPEDSEVHQALVALSTDNKRKNKQSDRVQTPAEVEEDLTKNAQDQNSQNSELSEEKKAGDNNQILEEVFEQEDEELKALSDNSSAKHRAAKESFSNEKNPLDTKDHIKESKNKNDSNSEDAAIPREFRESPKRNGKQEADDTDSGIVEEKLIAKNSTNKDGTRANEARGNETVKPEDSNLFQEVVPREVLEQSFSDEDYSSQTENYDELVSPNRKSLNKTRSSSWSTGNEVQKKGFKLFSLFSKRSPPTVAGQTHQRQKNVTRVIGDEESYFFRVVDDELLFKLGDSFHRDYKKGLRHFSFANVSAPESQKRSILGIASFINYFEGCRVLIITDQMDGTFYSVFKNEKSKKDGVTTSVKQQKYTFYHSNSINFVEVSGLVTSVNVSKGKARNLMELVNSIIADFDLVLFDLPPTELRKNQYDIYLPILQAIESVTFTIGLKVNKFSEINHLKNYFSSYKINIKGSILESYKGSYRDSK